MSDKKRFTSRAVLGVLTVVLAVVFAYYSYKTLAYILNWEKPPGDPLAAYTTYVQVMIYSIFILTSVFLLHETFSSTRGRNA